MTGATAAPAEQLILRLRAAGCVFAEQEAAILIEAADSPDDLERLVARRVAGEPLEHVLGWVEFGGIRLAVTAGVFVPRQRTEAVVDQAEAAIRRRVAGGASSPLVVDLCCGCAAIGTVVAHRLDRAGIAAAVHAADLDPSAVACAATNLAPFSGDVYTGDLYDPLPDSLRGTVDVIVANVPYVPTSALALMPPEARDHEPRVALDGGVDGLAVARRLLAGASNWLSPGGVVLFECDERQAEAAANAVGAAGLRAALDTDPAREVTVVTGTR